MAPGHQAEICVSPNGFTLEKIPYAAFGTDGGHRAKVKPKLLSLFPLKPAFKPLTRNNSVRSFGKAKQQINEQDLPAVVATRGASAFVSGDGSALSLSSLVALECVQEQTDVPTPLNPLRLIYSVGNQSPSTPSVDPYVITAAAKEQGLLGVGRFIGFKSRYTYQYNGESSTYVGKSNGSLLPSRASASAGKSHGSMLPSRASASAGKSKGSVLPSTASVSVRKSKGSVLPSRASASAGKSKRSVLPSTASVSVRKPKGSVLPSRASASAGKSKRSVLPSTASVTVRKSKGSVLPSTASAINAPPLSRTRSQQGPRSDPTTEGLLCAPPVRNIVKIRSAPGPKPRSSVFKGVTRYKRTGRWETHIWFNKKQFYLGASSTEERAARAHDRAAIFFEKPDKDFNFCRTEYAREVPQLMQLSQAQLVRMLRKQSAGKGTLYPEYPPITHVQEPPRDTGASKRKRVQQVEPIPAHIKRQLGSELVSNRIEADGSCSSFVRTMVQSNEPHGATFHIPQAAHVSKRSRQYKQIIDNMTADLQNRRSG